MFKRWFGGNDDKPSADEKRVTSEAKQPINTPEGIAGELGRLVREGRKIEAIRVYRDASGVDLKTAKEDIERLIAEVEQGGKAPAAAAPRLSGGEQLQADLEKALRTGKKIEAIKLYRQATGVGLKESKEAIDMAMLRGYVPQLSDNMAPAPRVIHDDLTEEDVLEALRAGKKINAVKLYRQMTGVGLKEAKEAVEALARRGL